MIVFDLECRPGGHVFEGWFGSSGDFDDQAARGLVSCPICGVAEVDKAVMAPRIGGGKGEAARSPAEVKAMLHALGAMQARMLAGSEHVGDRFASEARAIHDGERPERPIHGQATLAEARALSDDGIPVAPLPLPVRPPGVDN